MIPLQTHINPADPVFRANRERMEQLVSELRNRLATSREGGGPKYLERHRAQGKLPVRERRRKLYRDWQRTTQVAYHALAFASTNLNPRLSITWQHQDQPASFQNPMPAGIYRLKRCQYPLAFGVGSGDGSCATAFDDLAKLRFQ